MTNADIAKHAFTEHRVGRRLGGKFEPDTVEYQLALSYVTDAFEHMKALQGAYDPEDTDLADAKPLADHAAIEFVKARLDGVDPEMSAPFVRAKKAWQARAAYIIKKVEFDTWEDSIT